jgi:hypothetical protein
MLPPFKLVTVVLPLAVNVPPETFVTVLPLPFRVNAAWFNEPSVSAPPTVTEPEPVILPRFAEPMNSASLAVMTLKSLPDFREPDTVSFPDATVVPPVYRFAPDSMLTPEEVKSPFPESAADTFAPTKLIDPLDVNVPVPVTLPLMVAADTD